MNKQACTVRKEFQSHNKITPNEKLLLEFSLNSISWQKAQLCPFQYSISNQVRELHFQMLHNIYSCNRRIFRFTDLDEKCTLCKTEPETVVHLFCNIGLLHFFFDSSFLVSFFHSILLWFWILFIYIFIHLFNFVNVFLKLCISNMKCSCTS